MLGKENEIKISKQEAGTVFKVVVKHHYNGALYEGTMEIVDPEEKKLSFKLNPLGRRDREIAISTTEIDDKLKEGGAIAGSVPVGILRSFEIQTKKE